jgi:chromosome segregation ATPase
MGTTNVDLDDDVHAALRAKDDTMRDAINDAVRENLGIEDLSSADAVERRMAKRESELRDVREEREQLEVRETELESELERLEDQLETIEANAASLTEDLDEILDAMLDKPNMHKFAGLKSIKHTASDHEMVADDFVAKLQDRADERNLGIDDARFRSKAEESVSDGIAEAN